MKTETTFIIMNYSNIKKLALNELKDTLNYCNYAIEHNNTYNQGRGNEHYLEHAKKLELTIDIFNQKINKDFLLKFAKQFKENVLAELKDFDIAHSILSLCNYISFENGTVDFDKIKENNRLTEKQLSYFK